MDVKKDTERGISVLNRSCEGEGTMSCLMLARVFEEGKYLPPDAKRQAAALQVACLRGSVVACARLGHLYASGYKDVTRDETKAARFWRLGCPADGPADASACAALGRQLWRQRGPNDEVLALLVRACEWNEGCADAATVARELVWKKLYGQCHSGDGEACGKLAPWLLRKGCDALDEPSCSRFATHYPELAKPWFAERCIGSLIQGHHVWCKQHVRLGGTMPASPPAKPAR